jgi:hypothetical protein
VSGAVPESRRHFNRQASRGHIWREWRAGLTSQICFGGKLQLLAGEEAARPGCREFKNNVRAFDRLLVLIPHFNHWLDSSPVGDAINRILALQNKDIQRRPGRPCCHRSLRRRSTLLS